MSRSLLEAGLAIDHAMAQITPAVALALAEADGPEATMLIALGLMARVAGLCLDHIFGRPGRALLVDLAGIDPDDALWCIEAIANLRCDEIQERAEAVLTLDRRPS